MDYEPSHLQIPLAVGRDFYERRGRSITPSMLRNLHPETVRYGQLPFEFPRVYDKKLRIGIWGDGLIAFSDHGHFQIIATCRQDKWQMG